MSALFVRGWGAVSPAGWGCAPLVEALSGSTPFPPVAWPGLGTEPAGLVQPVPAPATRPASHSHPRFRRASAISQFAIAAAVEAVASARGLDVAASRLGIVVGTHTAPIRYSERFYREVLCDPAQASPILFPETVINAPASHLAAYFGGVSSAYTIIADQTAFVQALAVASGWLLDGRADAVVVVASEELAAPIVEGVRLFARGLVPSEGAGALVLAREPGPGRDPVLERITNAFTYVAASERRAAARAMRGDFPPGQRDELLVDSCRGVARVDRAEADAWRDWPGARLSPRRVLGEGLSAATAWQFVVACHLLAGGATRAANISVVGSNLQAIGARLERSSSP